MDPKPGNGPHDTTAWSAYLPLARLAATDGNEVARQG